MFHAPSFCSSSECITITVMMLCSLTKYQFDSQPLICFMWRDKQLHLDSFFHVAAKEMLSVVHKAREVKAYGLYELKDIQGWAYSILGRCDGSILMLIMSISVQNATAFSKKQHTLVLRHTYARAHAHAVSKQKLHTRNYNLSAWHSFMFPG